MSLKYEVPQHISVKWLFSRSGSFPLETAVEREGNKQGHEFIRDAIEVLLLPLGASQTPCFVSGAFAPQVAGFR